MLFKLSPLAILVVAVGCGGGGGHGGGVLLPNQPLTMTITSSTVPADGTTAAGIVLQARDKNTGNPVQGEMITLTATGSGNVITQPGPTDATGTTMGKIASTVAEEKIITATGPTTADVATGTVTFVAPPSGQNATLSLVSGDNQSAPAGAVLAQALVVKVASPSGQPIAGIPVTFTVTSGGGILSVTNASTDANGQASTTMRLGPRPGDNTVTVVAKSETGAQLTGSPLVFHETGH